MFGKSLCVVVASVFSLFTIVGVAHAQTPEDRAASALSLGAVGVARPAPATIIVAAPLVNHAKRALQDVKVTGAQLDAQTATGALPIDVREIGADAVAVVEVSFNGQAFKPGARYTLILTGTYAMPGARGTHPFRVEAEIAGPPAERGEGKMGSVQVGSHETKGGYPHQAPQMDDETNGAAPPVPHSPEVAGTPTPTATKLDHAQLGDPPQVKFDANDNVGFTGAGTGCSGDSAAVCAEPSGGASSGMIFVSTNWRAAYSTNGGGAFTIIDPTTVFTPGAVGFCCDQVVQYVASIDRFVWLMQGTGYRLAVASPAQIKSSGGQAWTYWELTPGLFGNCSADYPDLSVGDNNLYISWDAGGGKGCDTGFEVVRTSLAGLKAGGTITLDFTKPSDSSDVWGAHLSQDTGDTIFWAGHNGTTKLTVYSMKEGTSTYSWRDVGISSWSTNAPTSKTPDGQDWLAKNFNGPGGNSFPYNGVIGAARSGNDLWFGWTAGTDKNFKQAHIEIVELDIAKNFGKIQQVQVWNDDYAFGYPAFASNACTGELGMSFEYGGGGNWEDHVVGFWGDFVAYITSGSDTGDDRFGDYVSLRRAPQTKADPGNMFTGFGFGVEKPKSGKTSDIRYVLFGRPNCKSR
ncbi:MAG TPA: hypothetical protein VGL66_08730 [Caulobacteraceae bacterium]|jgi:hypothetical protein